MGKVITSGNALNRHDYRSQIMYFTLIDRFNNGDRSIDDPVDDERLRHLTNYMGGDLEGITQKIESGYFDSLEINSLWLSPITQNPLTAYQEYIEPQYYYSGYHGYWPISSSQVDHRFGNDESMQRLVDVAHDHDINILLDYVTNHVHEEHPLYQAHPEYATQLMLSDSTQNLRLWDEQRLTTWFDTFMPSLDFSNPDVISTQVDSTVYWLKKFGLDGYRHDATKHIPREFWIALTKRLKEDVMLQENRSIYQIGETYGSRDLIKSYISSGQLDAQFDFNLYFDAREVFAKDDQSFERLWTSMNSSLDYYGYHSMMGNITGNHDQARFVSLASGDVRFDEDQKMAGFEREIGVSDEVGYDKHRMLLGFVMTIPGVPVIYYGDEIAMPGAGDPDSRRMMRFDQLSDQEEQTRKYTRQLTKLRREEMPLLYGTTQLVEVSDQVLVYKRTYFGETCYMVFNKSEDTVELNLDETSTIMSRLNTATVRNQDNSVSLPPYTFDIISNY
jgi:glycosidase